MARIAGINIPMNKHVWFGLTHIYGVGVARAKAACEGAGVNPHTKVKDLTESEVRSFTFVRGFTPAPSHARRARARPTP